MINLYAIKLKDKPDVISVSYQSVAGSEKAFASIDGIDLAAYGTDRPSAYLALADLINRLANYCPPNAYYCPPNA